jgi:hypothetical protein
MEEDLFSIAEVSLIQADIPNIRISMAMIKK